MEQAVHAIARARKTGDGSECNGLSSNNQYGNCLTQIADTGNAYWFSDFQKKAQDIEVNCGKCAAAAAKRIAANGAKP